MLWSGVNAENARTHKILAAVAFARREKSLQFIFLTCCWCGVGGMQLIGWCVIEGAWGTCVSPPAQQLHVPICTSYAVYTLVRDSLPVWGDVRWRVRWRDKN
ncbi:hypothetical protein TcCL_NonESM10269 [Trypanosoma cruzi]|nr:hypothetical protein TcCL_NonESM10269 [Trypanosoma cruzi]